MQKSEDPFPLSEEFVDSLETYSLLTGKDYSRLPQDVKKQLEQLNKVVALFLKADIPWFEVKRFLLNEYLHQRTLPDLGMTAKILNLVWRPSQIKKYIPKRLKVKGVGGFPKDQAFKIIMLQDKILRMPHNKTRQKAIQQLFRLARPTENAAQYLQLAIQLRRLERKAQYFFRIHDYEAKSRTFDQMRLLRWSSGLSGGSTSKDFQEKAEKISKGKREYTITWANMQRCMEAYSILRKLENEPDPDAREEILKDYPPIFVNTIRRIRFLNHHASLFAYKIASHVLRGRSALQDIKVAEMRKSLGLPIKAKPNDKEVKLPRGKYIDDWETLRQQYLKKRSSTPRK